MCETKKILTIWFKQVDPDSLSRFQLYSFNSLDEQIYNQTWFLKFLIITTIIASVFPSSFPFRPPTSPSVIISYLICSFNMRSICSMANNKGSFLTRGTYRWSSVPGVGSICTSSIMQSERILPLTVNIYV